MKFFAIRHGPVLGKANAMYGWTDIQAADSPQVMISHLQQHIDLTFVKVVYTSDLRRCRVPAECIAEQFGLDLQVEPELREQNFGLWEGMTWDEVKEHYTQQWETFFEDYIYNAPPEGESFHTLSKRIKMLWKHIQNRSVNILLVGHAGPILILKGLAERKSIEESLQFECKHYAVFELDI